MEIKAKDSSTGTCQNCNAPYSNGLPYKIYHISIGGNQGGSVFRLCYRCKMNLIIGLETA